MTNNSVVLITGGLTGIGRAAAVAFAKKGAKVVVAGRRDEVGQALVKELRALGSEAEFIKADVRKDDEVRALVDKTVARFGRLDVAVNNAGVVSRGYSWELPLQDWQRVIDIDLWGVVNGIRSFVPLMLASGQEGHVVNTASMAAVLPMDRLGPYTVAKHGVLGLSDVLRAEFEVLGAPIGVSVVMPGMVKTAMNPIGTISADVVAAHVVDAMRRQRSYVFTDDQGEAGVRDRLGRIIASKAEESG